MRCLPRNLRAEVAKAPPLALPLQRAVRALPLVPPLQQAVRPFPMLLGVLPPAEEAAGVVEEEEAAVEELQQEEEAAVVEIEVEVVGGTSRCSLQPTPSLKRCSPSC